MIFQTFCIRWSWSVFGRILRGIFRHLWDSRDIKTNPYKDGAGYENEGVKS